jgi:hypothetical protein
VPQYAYRAAISGKRGTDTFHIKNGGKTVIGYTFRVGYTYRVDCTSELWQSVFKLTPDKCTGHYRFFSISIKGPSGEI